MNNLALWYRRFGEPERTLQPEITWLAPPADGDVRVRMQLAPVNASDLIPITGAYRHRTPLPAVAGYEGLGVVVEGPLHLVGKRVLPLRGQGTWQQRVDCPADKVVPVPDDIDDTLAARAYINPLAAHLMLTLWPPTGKRVLLTAAGSDCAALLGQWAYDAGATAVYGIHRSPSHANRLAAMGIIPVAQQDLAAVRAIAAQTDIVYDATGGGLADGILEALRADGLFICYGLLSGQTFRQQPQVRWFHIRNYLDAMPSEKWQQAFLALWPRLRCAEFSGVRLFPFTDWRAALAYYRAPGRAEKPLMVMPG